MKKGRCIWYTLTAALTITLLGMIWSGTAFAQSVDPKLSSFPDEQGIFDISCEANVSVEKSVPDQKHMFKSEDEIQHFAYLDIDTAVESLHPIILAARRIIIYRYSWAADEVEGWVKDRNGNILETLPHFSDLFPDDWEIPIESVKVDLSYYGQ